MATKIIMPQLGESIVEGTVTKWLRKEGETIQEGEALLEVTSDKLDTEIPSSASGTVLKILVAEGITVKAHSLLGWIGQPGEVLEDQPPAPQKNGGSEPQPVTPPTTEAGRDRELGFISPVVARLANEMKVDLRQVKGTGQDGRITKQDVLQFIEKKGAGETPAWETPGEGDLFRPTELMFAAQTPTAALAAPVEISPKEPPKSAPVSNTLEAGDSLLPHSTMRRTIAERMLQSKHISPHVTTVMEVDMHRVVNHLQSNKAAFEQDGVRLTYTAYFVSAIIAGLKAFPLANSSWSEQGLILHKLLNIGMAVSLGEEGLIVPVIKNADGLSLLGLARAINDLAGRARTHRLQPEDLKGGTFTLTNHGTSGSLFATPIINQPQCAILGVGAIKKRVVVIEDAIAIRPVVYLSLTFDHRILDGSGADGFLAKVVETLEKWA
jgi:2-oxoglutarate dehydrogenase E2 component (dihydrolipoamide succinyltransferase)